MRTLAGLGLFVSAVSLFGGGCDDDVGTGDEQNVSELRQIQILTVSDWHGQLDPVAVPNVGNVGGAAVLSSYFKKEKEANPNTLVLSAGDSFGATPPLSSFFGDEPTVLAMNAMGFDADGLGNHNFDAGLDQLAHLIDLADFPLLSANLKNVNANVMCDVPAADVCVAPYIIKKVAGVKVAIIGVTNQDAATLLKPGALGTIKVTAPAFAANNARKAAKAEGAKVFIALAHMGATGTDAAGEPTGPLMDFARKLSGFDVVVGDHTNVPVSETVNGALVVENKSNGLTYARIKMTINATTGKMTNPSVEFVTPLGDQVTADPAVENLLAPYRVDLAAAFDGPVAVATGLFPRGNNIERLGEVALGNLVTDAMREHYDVQLGFTNGGGLRASLPSSYAPLDKLLRRPAAGYAAGPPFDLVVGDVFAVLPFGNSVSTLQISGTTLWTMMEHSVEALPNPNGWFGQISGFKVRFDSTKPVGQRVLSIELDNGTVVAKSATPTFSLATSDFIASGGDGYTALATVPSTTRDKMADVLLAHIEEQATLAPQIEGRLVDVSKP